MENAKISTFSQIMAWGQVLLAVKTHKMLLQLLLNLQVNTHKALLLLILLSKITLHIV